MIDGMTIAECGENIGKRVAHLLLPGWSGEVQWIGRRRVYVKWRGNKWASSEDPNQIQLLDKIPACTECGARVIMGSDHRFYDVETKDPWCPGHDRIHTHIPPLEVRS
jgi:hypothetical protein